MDLIQFSCEPSSDIDLEYIIKILPRRRTQVLDAKVIKELLHLKLQTNCITAEEAKSWIKQFEENTKSTYSVATSKQCTGRYLNFKKYFKCQHNTRSKVLGICPPQLKRVHRYCESSSQMVFMDSTGTTDHGGSQMFILLTHGECGGLPLGVIITSSKNADAIQMGFQLLKDMVGSTIFGGYPKGPTIFLTDDSSTEQSAINTMWPRSRCLLSINDVLQSVWKWLVKAKNIPQQQRNVYFQDFKSIVFSTTAEDCFKKYEIAKSNINHNTYRNYFEGYWQRKELWALPYRNNILTKGNDKNNLSELILTIIKDKIYNRVEAFNVVQLIDFILTKFVIYYETRLMDTANNRLRKNILGKTLKIPPPGLIELIQTLNDSIILVPSETKEDFFYIVNIDGLTCTCSSGNTAKICKHLEWACVLVYSKKYNMAIDNVNRRKMYYCIATGCNPPKDWLLDIDKHSAEMQDTDDTTSHIEVVYESTSPVEESEVIKSEEEEFKERGQIILQEMLVKITNYIEKSPREIVAALEKMNVNMGKLDTIAGAASAFSNFAVGEEYHQRNSRSRIPIIHPTVISRRNASMLGGKKTNVGG